MIIGEEIYSKFPAILRDKIKKREIEFPDDTQFKYESVKAYRCVSREEKDVSPVTRADFKSYAELGKKKVRGVENPAVKPQYYGVSLYVSPDLLANCMHMPSPKKKMAEGYVFQEGGPQQPNRKTGHICWWLFEDVCLDDYKLIEWKG